MTIDVLLNALVFFFIVGLVFYAIWWFIGYVGIPEPFNKVIRGLVALVALVVVVNFLMGLAKIHPFHASIAPLIAGNNESSA